MVVRCLSFRMILIVVYSLILTGHATFAQALEDDYSRVVLKVNGMEFHKWEMNLAEILTQDQMFQEGNYFRPSELPAFKESMMESTIVAMLFYMEAKKEGIAPDASKVKDFIWGFQKRFASIANFEKGLEDLHVTPDQFTQVAQRYVMTQFFLDKKFDPLSKVAEEEARDYYEHNQENFVQPALIRASHILLKFEDGKEDGTEEKALEKAKKILRQLKNGENFAAIAREYSDCPSKKRGGDLGYLQKGDLAKAKLKPLEEVVFSMKIGQVSEPVESIYGYHLLFVEDKVPSALLSFDEVRDRLMEKMTQDRKVNLILQYGLELKQNAAIERLESP
ncbi:MAG: peptidylprolyl isomerase [Desulfatibacillum sp.]|nr:peptidylprolyl isomerase [Desulfatibacillum sp.]